MVYHHAVKADLGSEKKIEKKIRILEGLLIWFGNIARNLNLLELPLFKKMHGYPLVCFSFQ